MPPRKPRVGHRDVASAAAHHGEQLARLACRIQQCDDELTPAQLKSAVDSVRGLVEQAKRSNSPLLAFIGDKGMANIITLFGLALRRSSPAETADLGEELRVGYRRARSLISNHLFFGLRTPLALDESKRQLLLLKLTLRTHVPRCYAQLLVQYASALESRKNRRTAEAAFEVLDEVEGLLIALIQAFNTIYWQAITDNVSPDVASAATVQSISSRPVSQRAYGFLLSRELRESQLLDAWARCFLKLYAYEDFESTATKQLARMTITLTALTESLEDMRGEQLAAAPTLSYVFTAHTVQLLALLDGGHSYGMPATAPSVPLLSRSGGLVKPRAAGAAAVAAASGPVNVSLAAWTLSNWYGFLQTAMETAIIPAIDGPASASAPEAATSSAPAAARDRPSSPLQPTPWPMTQAHHDLVAVHVQQLSALPPLRARAMFDISLRAAKAAAAAWRPPAAAASGRGNGRQRRPPVLIDPADCAGLAHTALETANVALIYLSAGASGVMQPAAARAAWRQGTDDVRLLELWCAYGASVQAALGPPEQRRGRRGFAGNGFGSGGSFGAMTGFDRGGEPGEQMDKRWNDIMQAHPRVLSVLKPKELRYMRGAMLGAMLHSGGVPVSEQLLRQTGSFVTYSSAMIPWHEVLTHGSFTELAGLVLSAGKVLRQDLVVANVALGMATVGHPPSKDIEELCRTRCFQAVHWLDKVFDTAAFCAAAQGKPGPLDDPEEGEEDLGAADNDGDGLDRDGGGGRAASGGDGEGAAGSSGERPPGSAAGRIQPSSSLSDRAPDAESSASGSGGVHDGGEATCGGAQPSNGGTSDDGTGPEGLEQRRVEYEEDEVEPLAQASVLWSLAIVQLLPGASLSFQAVVAVTSDFSAPGHTMFRTEKPVSYVFCARAMLHWCQLPLAALMQATRAVAVHMSGGAAADAAAAVSSREVKQWRELLTLYSDFVALLGACARAITASTPHSAATATTSAAALSEEEAEAAATEEAEAVQEFCRTLQLACAALPAEMRQSLSGQAGRSRPKPPSAGPCNSLTAGNRMPITLEAVKALLARATKYPSAASAAEAALALAESLVGKGEGEVLGEEPPAAPQEDLAAAASLLMSPQQARDLVVTHVCANPTCLNLAGPSEMDRLCEGCDMCDGRNRYCCRECEDEHAGGGYGMGGCGYGYGDDSDGDEGDRYGRHRRGPKGSAAARGERRDQAAGRRRHRGLN